MSALYRSATAEQAVRSWCTSRLDGWGTPHRTAWLDTSLGRTHVVEAGAGDSTCVFLPGTNFNASTSLPLLDALAARFTVYAADLPGQPGLSAAARPRAEREGYARWIDDVLTEVRSRSRTADEPGRSRQVVLVGHSRGAAVALSARPETVAGLVLVSPAGLRDVRVTPRVLARTLGWLARPTLSRSSQLVRLMGGPRRPVPDELAHAEWLTLVARSTRTTGAPGPLPAELLSGWRERPTTVLVGAEDVFFPPSRLASPAREHLGVEPVVVPDAGHLLTDQDPASVAEAVGTVLASSTSA